MKPLDPRLLRYARAARGYLALTVALGVVTGALVVAQALLLAHALGSAVADGATLPRVLPLVGGLAGVVAVRPGADGLAEYVLSMMVRPDGSPVREHGPEPVP